MKRLILGVTIAALTLGSVLAGKPVSGQKTQEDNANYKNVPVTGSHIKQKVKKRNIIGITRNGNLLIIDQKEMQRNGNGQISDQLSRYPGISISGR